MSTLPEIPGMVWLKLAIPVPEHVKGAWDALPAEERWHLRAQVRQAAEDALDQMMGAPMPVIGDAVERGQ